MNRIARNVTREVREDIELRCSYPMSRKQAHWIAEGLLLLPCIAHAEAIACGGTSSRWYVCWLPEGQLL